MELKAGTTVDGRDSRYAMDDPYQQTVAVQIGTASTAPDSMILYNGVYIDGDVLVGFGGNVATVIKDQGATVTGYKGSLDENPEFPPVTPPLQSDTFKYYDKSISIPKKGDPNLYIDKSWNGRYTMIDLNNKGQEDRKERLIVKSGNDVVLHLTNTGTGEAKASIVLGVGCDIIVEKGATLNLYVDGNIKSGTNSGFNNLGTPPDLKLWGLAQDPLPPDAQQDWQLNAKSEYFGQVYAPEATVQVNNSGDLYGAFTAYSFKINNSGNLYYDGALRNVNPNDPGVRFVLKRWGEGEENLPYVAGL